MKNSIAYSTKCLSKLANDNLLLKFGVDKFEGQMLLEGKPSVIRTETKHTSFLFFFNRITEHRKLFFRWKYKWEVNNSQYAVILEPIVKKTVIGEDILYDLDTERMETDLMVIINATKT
jgi:hypothetical protein